MNGDEVTHMYTGRMDQTRQNVKGSALEKSQANLEADDLSCASKRVGSETPTV